MSSNVIEMVIPRDDIDPVDITRAIHTADAILSQIEQGALWTLGAEPKRITIDDDDRPVLAFSCRILPFKADGTRATRAVEMTLTITLDWTDEYILEVFYKRDGEKVEHFKRDRVTCFDLSRLFLALDFDGDTALNPRYA